MIRIRALKREGLIEIRITDSGPGIPAEIREKIMQPYFTYKADRPGDRARLKRMSCRMMRNHEGRLFLDTSEARTTFVMTWPALKSAGVEILLLIPHIK